MSDEEHPQNDDEPDAGGGDPPSSDGDDPDDERPIRWRPGRRHGRSVEGERREE